MGVHVLSAYLGMSQENILHIGDQFLTTGNDYAGKEYLVSIYFFLKMIVKIQNVATTDHDFFLKHLIYSKRNLSMCLDYIP